MDEQGVEVLSLQRTGFMNYGVLPRREEKPLFKKYSELGAYHWEKTFEAPWWRRSPREMALYELPLRLLEEHWIKGSFGVDAGCGDGVMLYLLSRLGGNPIGVELDETGLRIAAHELEARYCHVPLLQGTVYNLPLKAQSVGYITAIEVLEHLARPKDFLGEVARVLDPSGVLIITTPRRPSGVSVQWTRDPYHFYEYDEKELNELLKSCFDKVRVYGALPDHLDKIYHGTKLPRGLERIATFLFRIVSILWNPYLKLQNDPGETGCTKLVAVARAPTNGHCW